LAAAGLEAWAVESPAQSPGRLIVLFLRGGFDGLFAFAPSADFRLGELRPQLARTVIANGIGLGDTGFAAHPEAKALADLYAARELAFAACAGTIDTSRSHFQAQDIFELGNGASHGPSGFMARAAQALGGGSAITFTPELPLCFQGGATAPEVAPLAGSGLRLPEGRALQAIRRAHAGRTTGDALDQAAATAAEIDAAMTAQPPADRGAPRADGLGGTAEAMGRLLRANPRLTLAFVELGGFDTHANEEAVLARQLRALGDGLVRLKSALGDTEWRRTRLAVMSEFGRTARENGTGGTDHGHGGLFFVAGGSVAGGRMLGDFAGLADAALNEQRDLPVLADWRDLLAACMGEVCGIGDRTLDAVFPGRPRQRFRI
ncbi:MAG TPA: DUF1501 domain-containing protein, partial [Rhodocyclaceae bacterium]|nr:DUF1501 domain-containing protein [Rhodocyclaceae bacterium]